MTSAHRRTLSVGLFLLTTFLLTIVISGCGSAVSPNPPATSCPILKGVDLTEAHLSVATFTPARKLDGSPITDPTGRVSGCRSPYGDGTLLASLTGDLGSRLTTIYRADFAHYKSSGTPLDWSNIEAVQMPESPGSPPAVEIHFNARDRFGGILCTSKRRLPLKDAEALARALLRASARS